MNSARSNDPDIFDRAPTFVAVRDDGVWVCTTLKDGVEITRDATGSRVVVKGHAEVPKALSKKAVLVTFLSIAMYVIGISYYIVVFTSR